MPFITSDADGLFISSYKKLEIRPSFFRTVSFLLKKSLFFLSILDVDISIKENLLNKQVKCQNEIDKINSRLNNRDFISRAPKHIVDQEKTNYNNLKNDIKKISQTVKSL